MRVPLPRWQTQPGSRPWGFEFRSTVPPTLPCRQSISVDSKKTEDTHGEFDRGAPPCIAARIPQNQRRERGPFECAPGRQNAGLQSSSGIVRTLAERWGDPLVRLAGIQLRNTRLGGGQGSCRAPDCATVHPYKLTRSDSSPSNPMVSGRTATSQVTRTAPQGSTPHPRRGGTRPR